MTVKASELGDYVECLFIRILLIVEAMKRTTAALSPTLRRQMFSEWKDIFHFNLCVVQSFVRFLLSPFAIPLD